MPEVKVNQWPYEAIEVDVNKQKGTTRTTFKPMVLTIARVLHGIGGGGPYTAWQFHGDPTPSVSKKDGKTYKGVMWWAQGQWDEATQSTGEYLGPQFAQGDVVRVELSYREFFDKAGNPDKAYAVKSIELAPKTAATPAPAATPPATAEDAGYDDYVNKQVRSGRTHGMIGPDDRVPPPFEYPRSWQEKENRLKEASIERQKTLETDGTLIAAMSAMKTRTEEQDKLLLKAIERYGKLADELARLAPPAPAAEAGKDAQADLPWGDEEKK